jgi:hypothetical protein
MGTDEVTATDAGVVDAVSALVTSEIESSAAIRMRLTMAIYVSRLMRIGKVFARQ